MDFLLCQLVKIEYYLFYTNMKGDIDFAALFSPLVLIRLLIT